MRSRVNPKAMVLVAAGLLVCVMAPVLLMKGSPAAEPAAVFSFVNGLALAAYVSLFLAYAFVLYAAFEFNVKWMLAVLFVPLLLPLFVILHPRETKPAIPFLLLGVICGALYWVLI